MADNYLENAMEDLRNGKFFRDLHKKKKPSTPSKHIFIREINPGNLEKVREMVRKGIKISFFFPSGHEGSRLARTLKCHYRPISMGIPEDAEICD